MILKYNCPNCKKERNKEIAWIDPKRMKKPEMQSVFWCSCQTQLEASVSFKRDGVVEMGKVKRATLQWMEGNDLVISIPGKKKEV